MTKQTEEYLSDPHVLSRGVWASVAVATRNETFIAREKKGKLIDLKRPRLFHRYNLFNFQLPSSELFFLILMKTSADGITDDFFRRLMIASHCTLHHSHYLNSRKSKKTPADPARNRR